VNRHPVLHSPAAAVIAAFAAICVLSGAGKAAQTRKFECAGKSDNGMISVREFPTLHISGRRLAISGSDMFSAYDYELCAESDALVTFASDPKVCPAAHMAIGSLNAANGSFDKASGRLKLDGAQGTHGEYQCNGSAQKY